MSEKPPVIEVSNLCRAYGKTDAVNGLSLTVRPGRCYGFFGRNGAGKTTTIKCLLNLLKPTSGSVRLFGLDPARKEVETQSRLSWVPDSVAFYPWMRIGSYFDYLASFRQHWNGKLQRELVDRFELDPGRKATSLSKGEKMQVALVGALCPEPELLILDEPTSGLDPLVRRDFIKTVIGAYQDTDPENRTVFVSTHLINEFEGLIDEFTIVEQGREILSMPTEEAKGRFQKVVVRFSEPDRDLSGIECMRRVDDGRTSEVFCNGNVEEVMRRFGEMNPESLNEETLSLEEIFLARVQAERSNNESALA
jgi:ABC-2 type transport system ATP-binding protein